eukprot:CAMPEP_0183478922 /NCGR_PEP_ID=MMETSP0370-20130417/170753_1 /TAXON_ID=268820 /ORGANISM="Peridinium aciculiferum, Strain PAER-2" /LENGTH=46 /DNA_ID= /DNA_START= /DNA_END= /DNA_ORIENTATION=
MPNAIEPPPSLRNVKFRNEHELVRVVPFDSEDSPALPDSLASSCSL